MRNELDRASSVVDQAALTSGRGGPAGAGMRNTPRSSAAHWDGQATGEERRRAERHLERGLDAVGPHGALAAELVQPAGEDRRSHTVIVKDSDTAVAHPDVAIRRLHQLLAGRMQRAIDGALGEFFGGADIEEMGDAGVVVHALLGLGGRECRKT